MMWRFEIMQQNTWLAGKVVSVSISLSDCSWNKHFCMKPSQLAAFCNLCAVHLQSLCSVMMTNAEIPKTQPPNFSIWTGEWWWRQDNDCCAKDKKPRKMQSTHALNFPSDQPVITCHQKTNHGQLNETIDGMSHWCCRNHHKGSKKGTTRSFSMTFVTIWHWQLPINGFAKPAVWQSEKTAKGKKGCVHHLFWNRINGCLSTQNPVTHKFVIGFKKVCDGFVISCDVSGQKDVTSSMSWLNSTSEITLTMFQKSCHTPLPRDFEIGFL